MTQLNWLQRLWLRLTPYLISPIGKPTKWRFITAMAADPLPHPIGVNRYPRQIIGVGIRLPSVDMYVAPSRRTSSSRRARTATPCCSSRRSNRGRAPPPSGRSSRQQSQTKVKNGLTLTFPPVREPDYWK